MKSVGPVLLAYSRRSDRGAGADPGIFGRGGGGGGSKLYSIC